VDNQIDNFLAKFKDKLRLGCADIEELVDYEVDDELPLGLHSRFFRHIEECAECAQLFDETKQLVEIASSLNEDFLPQSVRDRLRCKLQEELGLTPKFNLHLVK
jgi:hypothetical protein